MRKLNKPIHFNRLFLTGKEIKYINQTIRSNSLQGNGLFTRKVYKMDRGKFYM